jgi:hypothetical protein
VLAAFTIASTSSLVMSPWTTSMRSEIGVVMGKTGWMMIDGVATNGGRHA